MSTPSAGSSQPGRPVESTGRSLDDAKAVGRAAETDGFAVTDGALADAAGVLVEGLWPTPGLTTVKSPNSVATARKIAPNPSDEVLSGRHEPSAYRSIVASVSVGSAARSTTLTMRRCGGCHRCAVVVGHLEPVHIAGDMALGRRAFGGHRLDRYLDGLGTGRKRQTGRRGQDLRLRLELGGASATSALAPPWTGISASRPWLLRAVRGADQASDTARSAPRRRTSGGADGMINRAATMTAIPRPRARTAGPLVPFRATTSRGRRARERPPAPRPPRSPAEARASHNPTPRSSGTTCQPYNGTCMTANRTAVIATAPADAKADGRTHRTAPPAG